MSQRFFKSRFTDANKNNSKMSYDKIIVNNSAAEGLIRDIDFTVSRMSQILVNNHL